MKSDSMARICSGSMTAMIPLGYEVSKGTNQDVAYATAVSVCMAISCHCG